MHTEYPNLIKNIVKLLYSKFDIRKRKKWTYLGVEPGTSRTQGKNHATRPTSHLAIIYSLFSEVDKH